MKKLIYSAVALAMAFFAASCQQEMFEPAAQETAVTYTVELPGVDTKAIADGSNVDKLIYEVWKIDVADRTDVTTDLATVGTRLYQKEITMVQEAGKTSRVNVTLNLVQDQEYTILFWAHNSEAVNGAPAYNTADLTAVTYAEGILNANETLANNESLAAFFAVDFVSEGDPRSKTVYLKRPFAQLNIGTLNTVASDEYTIDMQTSTVTVSSVPTVFNVATSVASGEAKDFEFVTGLVPNETLKVNDVVYEYAAMNYIFANHIAAGQSPATADVDFSINVNLIPTAVNAAQTTATIQHAIPNVPLSQNYRTNIVGNLLTSSTEYEVVVDASWAGDDLAPDPLFMAAATGGEVTLTEDVVLDKPLAIQADMTLDLNGKTVTGVMTVANGAAVTVENGTIVNTDNTVSGITSNGILTLDNVEIESARHAVRVESGKVVINGGTFKVAPVSASTLHALNVGDNGTTAEVIIKGGTFIGPKGTTADSGSAVNVRSGSKVVIEGGDFSGGKNKTLSCGGEMTITGGSFDQTPATYVADGYKVIEKDGKFYVVSEETDGIVADKAELQTALKDAVANGETNVVIDAEGAEFDMNYGLSKATVPAGTTVTIRNANVNAKSYGNGVNGTVVFEGCVFNNAGGAYSIHFDNGSGDVIFKNCDLYGWNSFGSSLNSVSFENCTLNGNGKYALIRSYVDLTLKNCTINTSNADHTDVYSEGVEAISPATLTTENVSYVVNSTEAFQAALDAATVGTTIYLTPNVSYGVVYLGRPTKYNNTTMTCESHGFTTTNAEDFKQHVTDGAWHGTPKYTTTISNLTVVGASGASVAGLIATSGHAHGDVYDYVLDKDYDSGSAYHNTLHLNNVKFCEVAFTGKVDINTADAESTFDGVTFDNCTFTTGGTASANGAAVRYYNESTNGQVKNISVMNCTFNNCYQGVYVQNVNGVAVADCEFDTTGHNAVGIQGTVDLKKVVITNNTFKNIKDRVIRFNEIGADSDITITGNTATASGDEDGEVMKATSIAAGVKTTISGNNWNGGIVVNPELQDK